MLGNIQIRNYAKLFLKPPVASAVIRGSKDYPKIMGNVYFYQSKDGVIVMAAVKGLPHSSDPCKTGVFGFHIHSGSQCTGNAADPFANAGEHYNPKNCLHPHHAGDLPPLFENKGQAFMGVLSNRFTAKEIIGKTVIIHAQPDNFTSQPGGNSGTKIACGQIKAG